MKFCPNCFADKYLQMGRYSENHQPYIYCSACGFQNRIQREERALPLGICLHSRYIIGRVLGIGGFGITYLAYDVNRKARFAVKEYFPAEWAIRERNSCKIMPSSQSRQELYFHGRDVFSQEAGFLSQLKTVPHIVTVWDYFMENETAYMVMDFLGGNTLRGYLKLNHLDKMTVTMANQVVRDVGMSLQRVHQSMLLHRDVGPDNIMMTDQQEVVLIDFGATRIYGLNSPNSMSVLVKEGFAPIEQYSRSGRQGPWTDIYALAATYYYLTSGVKPPSAPDRIAGSEVVPLRRQNQEITETISQAIKHAMAKDWRHRPQNMREFLDEMGLLKHTEANDPAKNTGKTLLLADPLFPHNVNRIPSLLMQVGMQRTRHLLVHNRQLSIGRVREQSNIVLEDKQVSGRHCYVQYDAGSQNFLLTNYSANRTYTSRGVLEKNQSIGLKKGEWFYIQTSVERYLFYLEVE